MKTNILIGAISALALVAWDGAATAQAPASVINDRELAALAGDDAARIVRELAASGYRVTEIRRSFLGRIRLILENDEFEREIVISNSTGEIKRDTVVSRVGAANGGNGQTGGGNVNGGGNGEPGGSGNGIGTPGGGGGNPGGGGGNPGGGGGNPGGGGGNPGGGGGNPGGGGGNPGGGGGNPGGGNPSGN